MSCGNHIGKEAVTTPLGDARDSETQTRLKAPELSHRAGVGGREGGEVGGVGALNQEGLVGQPD